MEPHKVVAGLLVFSLLAVVAGQGVFVSADTGLLTAHFIDVGQGDCCWLQLPNGQDVLVDCGSKCGHAGPTVVAYLQDHEVSDVEIILVSHPHEDHIEGFIDVIESFPVGQVILSRDSCSTGVCDEFFGLVAQEEIPTVYVSAGITFTWGTVVASVVNPPQDLYSSWLPTVDPGTLAELLSSDTDDNSVVLLVSYGDIDLLFTGDIYKRAESTIVARGEEVAAEILKVPHHGSTTSCSPGFLTAVSPSEAIMSADPGRPHEETLQRLANVGASIWRTDEDGTIIVTTDGITYTIRADLRATPTTTPTATVFAWQTLFMPLVLMVRLPTILPPAASPTPTLTPTRGAEATSTPTATPTFSSTPTQTSTPLPGDVRVYPGGCQFDAPGNDHDNLNEEYVAFMNYGEVSADMSGWHVSDESGKTYTFPSFTLAAGGTVTLHTGSETDTATDLYWGQGRAVWNNDGDTACLYDTAWQIVDCHSY